jgi:hypothetical protein
MFAPNKLTSAYDYGHVISPLPDSKFCSRIKKVWRQRLNSAAAAS